MNLTVFSYCRHAPTDLPTTITTVLYFYFWYYNKVGSRHICVRTILIAKDFNFIHIQWQWQDPWFGQKPTFSPSSSTCIRKERIFSLANTYKARSLVNNTHKALCLNGRSTDRKNSKQRAQQPCQNLSSFFAGNHRTALFNKVKIYFSSICLKTFIYSFRYSKSYIP